MSDGANSRQHAVRTSPCIKICTLDEQTGWCTGCGRSLNEIGGWAFLTDAEREAVLADLPRRMAALP